MSLFRVWMYDSNDRREIARVKATDFDKVQQFLLVDFIKADYRDDVELTDYGLEWNDRTPEDCLKLNKDEYEAEELEEFKEDPYLICGGCLGCTTGFEIQEVEDPDPDEYQFLTIYGTNDYYDLTQGPEKADNWDEGLYEAWKRDPQIGVAALILSTVRDHPELEKGFSPELIEDSKKKVES